MENVKKAPKSKKRIKKLKIGFFNLGIGLDIPLLVIVLSLLCIGLIVLFSASYPSALFYLGDSYYYITRQAGFAVAGVIAMLAISYVDYRIIRKFNIFIFFLTTVLMVLVLIPPFSGSRGEAVRWIDFGFISFQPSEIAKFALVVMLAHIISKVGDNIKTFRKGVLPCLIPIVIMLGIMVLQSHMSGLIIMAAISAVVLFAGGVKIRWFVIAGVIGLLALVFLIFFSDAFAYAEARVLGWLDPFNPPEGIDTHQTKQSIYAIGAGQLLGTGLGQSIQKYIYLPEARNDFIFPIACEELGFVGAILIIGLFIALVWRGVYIATNARDKFGALLAMGITFTIGIQACFNICVVTGAFPNTGISLPFFSYGGTSLLMLLGEMGVLLSISRTSYVEKT